MIRLDKMLCDMGAGTRSEVKAFIKKGRVTVDGAVAKAPEQKVDERSAVVCLDKSPLTYAGLVYYMLHKPAGVVTATRDRNDRTVMELMEGAPGNGLFPVGRLDRDTEGLLLITNDGILSHRLLSPKKHVPKTYYVRTRRPVTDGMLEEMEKGLDIGDEKPTLPAQTRRVGTAGQEFYLTLTEGRFHQVKRMVEAVGGKVEYLKRISMGPLILDDSLKKGGWRPLTEEEKGKIGV